MKRINMILAGMLFMAAPVFGICLQGMAQANEDGGDVVQTLTVSDEQDSRTVSEIRMDGNNAVLLFTNGEKLTVDMRLVTLTMSYNETTGVSSLRLGDDSGDIKIYDLQGRRVSKPDAKGGVYIVNGKKVNCKK